MQQARIIVSSKIEYERERAETKRDIMKRRLEAKDGSKQGKQVKKEIILRRKQAEESSRAKHKRAKRNKEMKQDNKFGIVELEQQAAAGEIGPDEQEREEEQLRRNNGQIRRNVGRLNAEAKGLKRRAKKTQKKIDAMEKKADKKRKTARKGKGKW
jgi:hypothetical protein